MAGQGHAGTKVDALGRSIEHRACVTSLSLTSVPCRRFCMALQHMGHLASVVEVVRRRFAASNCNRLKSWFIAAGFQYVCAEALQASRTCVQTPCHAWKLSYAASEQSCHPHVYTVDCHVNNGCHVRAWASCVTRQGPDASQLGYVVRSASGAARSFTFPAPQPSAPVGCCAAQSSGQYASLG